MHDKNNVCGLFFIIGRGDCALHREASWTELPWPSGEDEVEKGQRTPSRRRGWNTTVSLGLAGWDLFTFLLLGGSPVFLLQQPTTMTHGIRKISVPLRCKQSIRTTGTKKITRWKR